MISSLKDLINKTEELEKRLNKYEKQSTIYEGENLFSSYSNNNLFTNVTTRKTINLTETKNSKNQIYFQLQINFSTTSNQDIEFSILVNNIKIITTSQNFNIGSNNIILNGIHQDTVNEKLKIGILVNPKNDNLTVINSTNLLMWGNSINQSLNEYNCIETENDFYLSYLSNNRLYLKIIPKNNIESQDDINFNCISTGISHSLTYDKISNVVYLFRVDSQGNLFYSNLNLQNEIFIHNNVQQISSCHANNKMIFAFISNKKCYIGEIINNSVFINQLNLIKGNFISTFLYYKDKCYLIITKEDLSNYLLNESNYSFSNRDQLTANISLNISTYEAI